MPSFHKPILICFVGLIVFCLCIAALVTPVASGDRTYNLFTFCCTLSCGSGVRCQDYDSNELSQNCPSFYSTIIMGQASGITGCVLGFLILWGIGSRVLCGSSYRKEYEEEAEARREFELQKQEVSRQNRKLASFIAGLGGSSGRNQKPSAATTDVNGETDMAEMNAQDNESRSFEEISEKEPSPTCRQRFCPSGPTGFLYRIIIRLFMWVCFILFIAAGAVIVSIYTKPHCDTPGKTTPFSEMPGYSIGPSGFLFFGAAGAMLLMLILEYCLANPEVGRDYQDWCPERRGGWGGNSYHYSSYGGGSAFGGSVSSGGGGGGGCGSAF